MLHIKNLKVGISKNSQVLLNSINPTSTPKENQNTILQHLDLNIPTGTVHAIMGPNGSGKSTLAHVIMGNPLYDVLQGSIFYTTEKNRIKKTMNLLDISIEERARAGIFLAYQNPIEIPGLMVSSFLKEALNARRVYLGLDPMNALDFIKELKKQALTCKVDQSLLSRPLNVGLSGGEKKRLEILQMKLLDPSLIILDEIDSGLDVDALSTIGMIVDGMRTQNKSIMIITHFSRILHYVKPDVVHVIMDEKIIQDGDFSLVEKIEDKGYGIFHS